MPPRGKLDHNNAREALGLRLQATCGFVGIISGPVHSWQAFLF